MVIYNLATPRVEHGPFAPHSGDRRGTETFEPIVEHAHVQQVSDRSRRYGVKHAPQGEAAQGQVSATSIDGYRGRRIRKLLRRSSHVMPSEHFNVVARQVPTLDERGGDFVNHITFSFDDMQCVCIESR